MKVTYPTRIQDEFASQVLDRLGEFIAPITRATFKNLVAGKKVGKSQIHQAYQIPNRYGHGILVDVRGRLDSYVKCLKLNIETTSTKLQLLTKKLQATQDSGRRWHLSRKIRHKELKLAKFKLELKTKKYSYTFGSKKLFKAQYYLKENGYSNHQEWQDAWRLHRNYNFCIIGSKDESYGNQNCQLQPTEAGFRLQLRIPDGLLAKLDKAILDRLEQGKYLVIQQLNLPRNTHKKKEVLRGFEFLREAVTNNPQAITTRLHKDDKGWILAATTSYAEISPNTLDAYGVIGVDINKDHLAVCETSSDGNPIHWFNIPLELDNLSSNARENLISHSVLRLVKYAREKNKDIVVERLDFARKKRELGVLHGKAYARMLSSFAYKQIIDRIHASSYYRGVCVHTKNPAYSSLIGRFKFSRRYGLSTHQAAALVIARRYLSLSERLPKFARDYIYQIGRDQKVLKKPADSFKHPWARWAKVQKQIRTLWAKKKSRTKDPPLCSTKCKKGMVVSTPLVLKSKPTMRAVALGRHLVDGDKCL